MTQPINDMELLSKAHKRISAEYYKSKHKVWSSRDIRTGVLMGHESAMQIIEKMLCEDTEHFTTD